MNVQCIHANFQDANIYDKKLQGRKQNFLTNPRRIPMQFYFKMAEAPHWMYNIINEWATYIKEIKIKLNKFIGIDQSSWKPSFQILRKRTTAETIKNRMQRMTYSLLNNSPECICIITWQTHVHLTLY